MATVSYLTPIYSRSQNEVQGDLHKVSSKVSSSITAIKKTFKLIISDSRPEGLGSMPDATKYPPSTPGERAR
ncbi:hypothetical protein TNCV_4027851 [Trichonephila clavipes]|nr:hypothetical protein TNCV_4027851 [Trichonephila clavipes]